MTHGEEYARTTARKVSALRMRVVRHLPNCERMQSVTRQVQLARLSIP